MGGGPTKIAETSAQEASANVAAQQWNDYESRFVPFENKYLADVTADPTTKEAVVAGRVNSDLAKQNNGAIPAGQINRIGSIVASNTTPTMAAAGANAMTTAKGAVRDSQIQGQLSAVNMGRGQATGAIDSMGSIASQSAELAQNDAETAFNNNSAAIGAIGSGVGAAAAAGNKYL